MPPGERPEASGIDSDPAFARRIGLLPAPEGRRSSAFAIDAATVLILGIPAIVGAGIAVPIAVDQGIGGMIGADGPHVILLLIGTVLIDLFILIQLIVHGRRGVTVGKALLGLRSVNVGRLDRPGFWRIVLRALVLYVAAVIVPVIGGIVLLVSGLWDRERRGRSLLDRIASVWVIDARRGLDPFDAKALRLARRRENAAPAAPSTTNVSLATGAALSELAIGQRSRSAVVGIPGPGLAVAGLDGAAAATASPIPQLPNVVPPPPARAGAGSTPTVVLVDENGIAFEIGERALIGRGPSARQGEDTAVLLHVDDPSFSMSKTHALIGVDREGLWIEDRGSSNGSMVVGEDGVETLLVSGSRHRVASGDILYLGTRRFSIATKGSRR